MSTTPTVSVKPVVLPAPGRGEDLQVRVTAPLHGTNLPAIVFSHGYGWSMTGYDPLVDHWAGHGFVVLQPTHLDSRSLALPPEDPRTPDIWRWRIRDLVHILDEVGTLEAAVPGLAGRIARDRVAVAGHSWGATTASALLGARVVTDGVPGEDLGDPRVRAAVLLALAGHGEDDLTPFAAEHFAFMSPDFARLATPALMVAGEDDRSPLSTRGPDWWADGYHQSPSPKSLLTLAGAQHSLGGIPGYGVTETTDENPARVALIGRVSTAYLQHALGITDEPWARAQREVAESGLGRLESK